MKAIAQLSQKYGFQVIEDAAHGIGGRYGDNSSNGQQDVKLSEI
jgi:dTDP-4-amino-4,6-dideoxygalactose transaminase